jgi:hypothetical protein
MALNPLRVLMPKDHSIGHKAPRLAFGCPKGIKANAFVLPVRSCKTGAPIVNLDWGNIPLNQ